MSPTESNQIFHRESSQNREMTKNTWSWKLIDFRGTSRLRPINIICMYIYIYVYIYICINIYLYIIWVSYVMGDPQVTMVLIMVMTGRSPILVDLVAWRPWRFPWCFQSSQYCLRSIWTIILLVLNVGNGWVAGGMEWLLIVIINYGSFPKIPYV